MMAGPSVQMPGPVSQMFTLVYDTEGKVVSITMRPEWGSYLSTMQLIAYDSTRSGSTSVRPPSSMLRWAGMPFFDQTLGQPVFLKHASSNVWVTADGVVA